MNTRAFIKSLFVAPLAAKAVINATKPVAVAAPFDFTQRTLSLEFRISDSGDELFRIRCLCGAKSEEFTMPGREGEHRLYPNWHETEQYERFKRHQCQ